MLRPLPQLQVWIEPPASAELHEVAAGLSGRAAVVPRGPALSADGATVVLHMGVPNASGEIVRRAFVY